jgi:hypothetical protein
MRRLTSEMHMRLSSLCTAAVATDDRYSGEPARHAEPRATIAATATQPAVPDERVRFDMKRSTLVTMSYECGV